MSTISVDVSSSKIPVLQVGYQGENEVTEVLFNISSWIEEYGEGTAQIRVKRPQNSEDESYLISLPISGGVAIWTVTSLDTANKGNGKVQLNYLVGTAIKDSVIYPYKVGKSIIGADSPVDPFDSWIERSKAWSIGELLDDEEVPPSDETYRNNSKFYAGQAEAQAVEAKAQADTAKAQADTAKQYAHQFVGAPRTASTSSDMTDHDLVYVFTGTTTSSLTNGHWYYWNGSAWTDGGVYNSTALTTDTTLSVSGAAADARAAGDLKDDLINFNSFNIIHPTVWEDGTTNGITYTKNSDNSYHASGTSTASNIRNITGATNKLPDGMEAGKTYNGYFDGTNVRLAFAIYVNGTGTTTFIDGTAPFTITIPSNATGCIIRLYVAANKTVDETVHPYLLTTPSNIEIYNKSLINNGYLPNNTDFNNLKNNSVFGLSTSRTYQNAPISGVGGIATIYDMGAATIQHVIDNSDKGSFMRFYLNSKQVWSDWTRLGAKDINTAINTAIDSLKMERPVKLLKSGNLFYVRTQFNDSLDAVTNFSMPHYTYNFTFNFLTVRMIPHDTEVSDTITAFTQASAYKLMNDDIPAIDVNGTYLGSNHGNPNYTQCYCTHNLTEDDIGTVWTDSDNNSYTIVQVFPEYIIAGSLNSSGDLTVRNPSALMRSGTTITVTSANAYQLRRSAINKKWTIVNESGEDIYNGGSGNNVIVREVYDIQDQSKGLAILQNNVGSNTNDSYYSDDNPYIIAHIDQAFQFNRGGSITCYGSLEAKEEFTDTRLFGMMGKGFRETDGSTDYAYIPQSSNFADITAVPVGQNTNILKTGNATPYRFYQYTNNRGYFLQYINNLGDVIASERSTLANAGYFAAAANEKLYPIIKLNTSLDIGEKLTWGYGRGPMERSNEHLALNYFDAGNGWIASADWKTGYDGYFQLPNYMSGHEFEVIDKTDNATVTGTFITNKGFKVSCTGSGYVVIKIN